MRAYFFSVIVLLFSLDISAQTLYFSNPVTVAPASGTNGQRPRITLVHDSIPMVVYGQSGSDPALFSNRWMGSGFSSTQRLTSPGTLPLVSYIDGPEIKSTGDTVFITYAEHTDAASVILLRSFDGGQSIADSINVYLDSASHLEFADLAILPGGNPVITFLDANLSFTAIQMSSASSTDGGATFSNKVSASQINAGEPCECCPSSLVYSNNQLYLAYRNNISNIREFYVSVSADGGASYTSGMAIENSGYFSTSCPSNGVRLLPVGDSVYASFAQKPIGNTYMNIYNTSFHASNFGLGPLQQAEPTFPNYNQFRSVVAGSGDTLFVLWQDGRDGNLDVYISYRTQYGQAFSIPQKINHLINGTQIDVDAVYKNGQLHIVWLDSQNDNVYYRRAAFNEFVSVEELTLKQDLIIYPNPSSGQVTLELLYGQIQSVEIYSLDGKLMQNANAQNASKLNIPTGELPIGMYLVKSVLTNGNTLFGKIQIIE